MPIKILCTKCGNNFSVVEAFPGTRVFCPSCNACLILAIQQKIEKSVLLKQGPQIITPEKSTTIHKQALDHLANWLDIPSKDIDDMLGKIESKEAYTTWKIPKGESGLFREITAPCEVLKKIQRRILDRILYRIPISNAAHGFVPGRSIVTNAQYHLKTARAILNLDLKDAFPSVLALRVKHLYVRYAKIPLKHLGEDISPAALDEVIEILVKLTTYQNCLPQGGPCSGYLLDIACITLDKNIYRLLKLLKPNGDSYRYTRYADDITISSPTSIPETLQQDLSKVIHDSGFQVNPRKCHYADRGKGQILEVTGLILEKDKVRIPAEKLENYRVILFQASNLAIEQLLPEKRLEIQSIVAFVKMVYGRIPPRLWKPYKTYLDKVGIPQLKSTSKTYLDLYPDT